MRAVFLHVLGDALGSVVVIVSALVIKFVKADWKYKVDPAMSLVMVVIILSTTIPLLKETAFILLQTVPGHIQVKQLQDKLIKKVQGVMAVHEFHIWQLTGNRIIATAHIRCQNLRDYKRIAEEVKEFFHNEGIHSTTIQPEFVENEELTVNQGCVLECGPDKTCYPDTCCGAKVKKDKKNKDSPAEQTPDNKSSNTSSADSSEHDQNDQIPPRIDETGL